MDDMAIVGAIGLALFVGIYFRVHLLNKKTED